MLIKLTEHDIQAALITWADLVSKNEHPDLAWLFAIPNGAKLPYLKTTGKNGRERRFSPEAQRLNAEGLRAGVPDLCLPVPRGEFHGLYLEMKSSNGKIRPEQAGWIDFLRTQGYYVVVAWDFDQAQSVLVNYLSLPLPQRLPPTGGLFLKTCYNKS